MKITYTRNGDYLFPDLILPKSKYQIGKYGMLRETYLKEHRSGWYTSMLLSGKLDKHLAENDLAANERFDAIVDQMKAAEGVTEKLKAEQQFLWIQKVENITNRAEEIILQELVDLMNKALDGLSDKEAYLLERTYLMGAFDRERMLK
ncbi:MAG: TnpV protein [Blautia sp.]|nr:TnpV protein [Blautia sp.]